MAVAVRKTSPFRLLSLLRLEKDPNLAFHLFQNPNPSSTSNRRPFRYSARAYDLIICKLGRARMFPEMESILEQMQHETRFIPREPLFCAIISFYGRARMPAAAVRAYDRIPSFRCTRTCRSFNSLLHALLSCHEFTSVRELRRALGSNELGVTPDACTYNILLRACTSLDDARVLFDEMREKGIWPTAATFGTLISAMCADLKLDSAFNLKDEMIKSYGIKPNVYIYTSLIKALCKNEQLELALKLKNEILLDGELSLDSAIYSTIIRALFRVARKGEVVGILEEMRANSIKPDTVTYNAMIAGFCEEREFDAAFEVLNEMVKHGCKADVVSYNTIIAGFCKENRWREACDLFEDMPRRECRPDVITYRTLFDGMCESGEFQEAKAILDEMMFKGYVPGVASVRRLVEGLGCGGGAKSLGVALCGLAKQNAVELDVWEMRRPEFCRVAFKSSIILHQKKGSPLRLKFQLSDGLITRLMFLNESGDNWMGHKLGYGCGFFCRLATGASYPQAALSGIGTLHECKEACSRNASCQAAFFTYDSEASVGQCYLPSDVSPSERTRGSKFVQDSFEQVEGMPARFSYKDICIATENFCQEIGRGGFGIVFKAVLKDGTLVAVKQLKKKSPGMDEFFAELDFQ
ncbi:hypothetical protein J5N97_026011 [Dioscorea zingiberensis]|uniref:Protein kinase domain-containing protein n=1 Tax=Dioscorea zingiberensis TaxID=325984 RepID=A0A9D5C2M4_9LILI|nr:hypothetical protein J5N97_026011 [Dioscorea zingiberensis]